MRHAATVLLFCAASQNSWGHVTESHSTQKYEVTQAPGTSLLQALNSASPIHRDGHVYHGHTSWNVHWSFQWNTLPNGMCAITSVNTTLTTITTLPQLRRPTGADSPEFDTYLSALIRHEEGHKQFGQNAANEIDSAITHLGPQPNCKSIESEANSAGRAILDRTREAEIEYDRSTKHGCTQGACLKR
jgi:predicted secreted Zn-dependent protease